MITGFEIAELQYLILHPLHSAASPVSLIYTTILEGIRRKHFDVEISSLRNLFESVDNQNITDFIKETHFYNLL